jgi:RimJ/RimL family protein N-acetyltransferase
VLDQRRSELAAYLKEHGVETGVHWIPAHQLTWLRNSRGATNLPVTDKVGEEILTLPLWSFMPETIILGVANWIREFFGRANEAVSPRPLRGRPLLDHIKATRGDPYRIPVPNFPGVSLRAISTAHPEAADVEQLSVWRNENVRSFLTEFEATPARTLRWLTSSVAQDSSRILFMIDEEGESPLGYIGLAFIDWKQFSAEADSVVRGRAGRSGVMSSALKALLGWARQNLGLSAFGVRVLADNPANSFYSRFGFRERARIGLRRESSSGLVAWREIGPVDADNGRSLITYDLPERESDG